MKKSTDKMINYFERKWEKNHSRQEVINWLKNNSRYDHYNDGEWKEFPDFIRRIVSDVSVFIVDKETLLIRCYWPGSSSWIGIAKIKDRKIILPDIQGARPMLIGRNGWRIRDISQRLQGNFTIICPGDC